MLGFILTGIFIGLVVGVMAVKSSHVLQAIVLVIGTIVVTVIAEVIGFIEGFLSCETSDYPEVCAEAGTALLYALIFGFIAMLAGMGLAKIWDRDD